MQLWTKGESSHYISLIVDESSKTTRLKTEIQSLIVLNDLLYNCFSIGLEDHVHSPNVTFHKLGLWGSDYKNGNGWKLNRLSTIKNTLGHTEVQRLYF